MIPPTFGRISRSWCKTTTCQAPIPIPNCLFWPPPARFVALRLGRDANQSFIVPGLLRAQYPSKLGTALPSKWCACESPRAPMLMLCLATLAFVPPVDNRLGHLIAADPRISWHDYAVYYTACPPLVAPSVERCEARPGEAALTWMDLRSAHGAHLSHTADEANFYTEYTRRAYTQYGEQRPPTAPRNTRLVPSWRIRPQPNLFAEILAGVGRRHSRTAAARHTAAPTSFLATTYNRLPQSTPKSHKISTATSDPRPIWHT
jgi:hypothetical protein